MTSLALYKSQGCSIVVGDLYIMSLASSITSAILETNLRNVQSIRGSLYVVNNANLLSLGFLSGLTTIQGGVYFINNPVLIDARIGLLTYLSGAVEVIGCDRLCSSRHPHIGAIADDSGCTNPILEVFLHVNGDANAANVPALCETVGVALSSIMNGTV